MITLITIGVLMYLYGGYLLRKQRQVDYTLDTNIFQDICRTIFFIGSFFGTIAAIVVTIYLILKYLP